MVQYELMVIGSDKQESEATFEKLKKLLEAAAASNVSGQSLGKKQLAYPIRRLTEADYFLYNFEADAEVLKKLSDRLRLEQEMIVRYLITKYTPKKVTKVSKVSEVDKFSYGKSKVDKKEEVKVAPKVTVTTKAREEVKEKVSKSKKKK